MGYIYIIKNTINNKVYIGQTQNDPMIRWRKHLDALNKSSAKLYRAMRELGYTNFYMSVLEECSNDSLDEKEIHWIKHFDSMNSGYNSTAGGRFSCDHDIDWLSDMLEDYYKGMSYKNIAIKYNVSINHIGEIIALHVDEKRDSSTTGHTQKHKKIVMYDRYFEPIRLFNTIADAVAWLQDNTDYSISKFNGYTYITAACEKGNIAYGRRWQYNEDLVQGDMVFRTKFDKDAYNNGYRAYKREGQQYYITESAFASLKNYKEDLSTKADKKIKVISRVDNRIASIKANEIVNKTGNKATDEILDKDASINIKVVEINSKIPDLDILEKLVAEYSLEEIGRRYEVSGKTVRNWCDKYGILEKKRYDYSGVTCVEYDMHFDKLKDAADWLTNNGYFTGTSTKRLAYNISQAKKSGKAVCGMHWV